MLIPMRKVMFLFKVGRLPDALKRLFSFRVAFIDIKPDRLQFLLHSSLQNTEIQNIDTSALSKSKLRTLLLS